MSEISIANKAAQIGNATQQFENTRARVRAVLDDINTTKANKEDLEAEFAAIQAGQEAQDNLIQDTITVNNGQNNRLDALEQKDLNLEEQITNINAAINNVNDNKIDKPTTVQPVGAYFNFKSSTLPAPLGTVSQVAVSQGGSQGILYFNGVQFQGTQINYSTSLNTVGIAGAPPSDSNLKMRIWGGLSVDRLVIPSTSFQPIANSLRWDGTSLCFSISTSSEEKVAFGSDIPKHLPTMQLISYTNDGTNYYIRFSLTNITNQKTIAFVNTGLNNSNIKLYLNGVPISSYSATRISGSGTIIGPSLDTNNKSLVNIIGLITIPKADNPGTLWIEENGVITLTYMNNVFGGDNLPLFGSMSIIGTQLT